MLTEFGPGARVLLACTGNLDALRPALEDCRAAWPHTTFSLLIPAPERAAAPEWAAEVLAPESFWLPGVPEQLRARAYAAALILTAPGDSPHGLGYVCALAGIGWTAGVSAEFGGQTLTRWVRPTALDPAPTLLRNLRSPSERS